MTSVGNTLRRVELALRAPAPHEWVLLGLLLYMTDHYRWLMDDAFIYFRYLDNLLFLDRGLVFNQGEYVEGYSSPLWLLVLLPLRALELDYYAIVRVLALVCAGTYGALLIAVNRALSPPSIRINFPLAASAAHYGITTHFSSGLETPLVQVLAALFAALALWPRHRVLQALAGLAPLVRHELLLPVAVYVLWLAIALAGRPLRVRDVLREIGPLLTALALGLLGWLAFRVYYYADLLPNTFYLKDEAHYAQGYQYFRNVSVTHHWPFVLAALAGLYAIGRRALPSGYGPARVAMLVAASAYGLYVVRIGGDMLYHRYASFPVALALCATAGIPEAAIALLRSARVRSAAAVAAVSVVTVFFGLCYPPQLARHPFDGKAKHAHWQLIADPIWHRRHKELRFDKKRGAQDRELRERYAKATPAQRVHDGVIVTGFCRQAYVEPENYVVHELALTDAVLARIPGPLGRPGHKIVTDVAYRLVTLHERDGLRRGRGMFDRFLRQKPRPRFVKRNLAMLRVLEKKVYNRHDLVENLSLAFTRIELR